MKISALKSAIDSALDQIQKYPINKGYQIAVYSNGSTSGLLERNSWEEVAEGVYELCRVSCWYDKSQSDNKNSVARREEKKHAFDVASNRLFEIATL